MSTELKTGDRVIYVDAKSVEFNALVTRTNPFNPGFLSLIYIDANGQILNAFDVAHMDNNSKQEVQMVQDPQKPWDPKAQIPQGNPDLPTIHLNCWRYEWDDQHTAPAPDHPMFDHPFAPKPTDEDGRPIPASRPQYEAQVAAHQAIHVPVPTGDDNPEVEFLEKQEKDQANTKPTVELDPPIVHQGQLPPVLPDLAHDQKPE